MLTSCFKSISWKPQILGSLSREFSQFPALAIKNHQLPSRPKVNEDEIHESFLKGGRGPGGQKVSFICSLLLFRNINQIFRSIKPIVKCN